MQESVSRHRRVPGPPTPSRSERARAVLPFHSERPPSLEDEPRARSRLGSLQPEVRSGVTSGLEVAPGWQLGHGEMPCLRSQRPLGQLGRVRDVTVGRSYCHWQECARGPCSLQVRKNLKRVCREDLRARAGQGQPASQAPSRAPFGHKLEYILRLRHMGAG